MAQRAGYDEDNPLHKTTQTKVKKGTPARKTFENESSLAELRQKVRFLESEKVKLVEIVRGFDPPTNRRYLRAIPAKTAEGAALTAVSYNKPSQSFDRSTVKQLLKAMVNEDIRLRRLQARDSLGVVRAVGHHLVLLNKLNPTARPFTTADVLPLVRFSHQWKLRESTFERLLDRRAPLLAAGNIVQRLARHLHEFSSRRAVFEALHYRELSRLLAALHENPGVVDAPEVVGPLNAEQVDRMHRVAKGLSVDFGKLEGDTRVSILVAAVEYAVYGRLDAVEAHPSLHVGDGGLGGTGRPTHIPNGDIRRLSLEGDE